MLIVIIYDTYAVYRARVSHERLSVVSEPGCNSQGTRRRKEEATTCADSPRSFFSSPDDYMCCQPSFFCFCSSSTAAEPVPVCPVSYSLLAPRHIGLPRPLPPSFLSLTESSVSLRCSPPRSLNRKLMQLRIRCQAESENYLCPSARRPVRGVRGRVILPLH